MKNKILKLLSLLLALTLLCAAAAGCAKKPDDKKPAQDKTENTPAPEKKPEAPAPAEPAEPEVPVEPEEPEEPETPEEPEVPEEPEPDDAVYVCIGTVPTGFSTYEVVLDEVNGESLIAAIAELTGWNLSVDGVYSGKGGVTVSFTPECALVTGPPEEQKEEFYVYDNYSLARMILDSIQETLRRNFVLEPGDPESLDVWYCIGDAPVVIEDVTVPLDEPYDGTKIF